MTLFVTALLQMLNTTGWQLVSVCSWESPQNIEISSVCLRDAHCWCHENQQTQLPYLFFFSTYNTILPVSIYQTSIHLSCWSSQQYLKAPCENIERTHKYYSSSTYCPCMSNKLYTHAHTSAQITQTPLLVVSIGFQFQLWSENR